MTKMEHVSTDAGCSLTLPLLLYIGSSFSLWKASELCCFLSPQGQFCWTSLWSGIKTNRCPRTLCIAAKESLLPQLCQPLAINCCLYQSACCFSCTVSLLQGHFSCFAIEWASSACCVALFSWKAALQFVFTLQIGEFANVLTVIMCILLFKFCICV